MSWTQATEPVCTTSTATSVVETTIEGRSRDLGGFAVRRVLPAAARKFVGPFIFFDHMGPVTFAPGAGMDVRPHPHINLATVTYLFEGEILHRDSLGSVQVIRPGEINWMTAGRGIVHSERTAPDRRSGGQHLEGIQLWVALPRAHEETEPEFHHHAAGTLPELQKGGAHIRVLAGKAYGAESPVHTFSPLFYVDVVMAAGSELSLPSEYEERAVYIAKGVVCCGPERAEAARMLVFSRGSEAILHAESPARVVFLGGAPIDGQRHIWWNFVSSSQDRIEQAKADWRNGRFAKVADDDLEFIPLPE